MRKNVIFILTVLFCSALFVTDGFPLRLGNKDLVRLGTGNRSMFLVGAVYRASLWVPEELRGKSAKEIIEANEPSAVIMDVTSKLITRERFVSAVRDGFGKAAASGYRTDKADRFLALFDNVDLGVGDRISLYYVPGTGVSASVRFKESGQTKNMGATPGLDFKQALYAIWLGPNPVQESLKKGMLGQ